MSDYKIYDVNGIILHSTDTIASLVGWFKVNGVRVTRTGVTSKLDRGLTLYKDKYYLAKTINANNLTAMWDTNGYPTITVNGSTISFVRPKYLLCYLRDNGVRMSTATVYARLSDNRVVDNIAYGYHTTFPCDTLYAGTGVYEMHSKK